MAVAALSLEEKEDLLDSDIPSGVGLVDHGYALTEYTDHLYRLSGDYLKQVRRLKFQTGKNFTLAANRHVNNESVEVFVRDVGMIIREIRDDLERKIFKEGIEGDEESYDCLSKERNFLVSVRRIREAIDEMEGKLNVLDGLDFPKIRKIMWGRKKLLGYREAFLEAREAFSRINDLSHYVRLSSLWMIEKYSSGEEDQSLIRAWMEKYDII